MYVTPEHFRAMDMGIDLTGVENDALSFHLTSATNLVDSYCSVPTLPQKFDFRGGTMTDETHTWRVSDGYGFGTRRVHLWARPIISIDQMRIYLTNTQYYDVDPDNLLVNQSGGYIELASLALSPFGVFGIQELPIYGVLSPISKTTYTYGWRIPVVGEQMWATDGLLFRAQHQFWADAPPPVIYKDGVDDTANVTLDLTEGTALYATQPAAEEVITADYTYTLPSPIATATAIICNALMGERELAAKGMNRLESIEVEEVRLRRTIPQRAGVMESSIPDAAKALLDGYVFITAR
jgi:hypothetical protein